MRRSVQSSIAIYALLFVSCLTVVDGVSRPLSFVCFAAVFVTIISWVWQDGSFTITFHPTILAGTLLVWFALIVGFLGSPNVSGFLRLGAFIGISGALLFILPNTFTPDDVYRAVAWLGASFVLVALPTTVVGELGPLGIWRTYTLFGVQYFVPTSVFDNPNMLGALAAMGGIAAAGEFLSARSSVRKLQDIRLILCDAAIVEVLAGICAFGVVLSTGRGSLLALVAGVGVCISIYIFGRDVTAVVTIIGVIVFLSAIGTAAQLIPGPEVFQSIGLSGRGILWQSVIRAVGEHPLLGWGPGADGQVLAEFVPSDSKYVGYEPHNSYIRMFFIGGLIGGIGYLILCLSALRTALSDATPHGAATGAMVISVFVLLMFNGATIFGLNPVSVVGALTVGFVQLSSRNTRSIQVHRTLNLHRINSSIRRYIN